MRTDEEKAKAKAAAERLKEKKAQAVIDLETSLATAYRELHECRLALLAYQRQQPVHHSPRHSPRHSLPRHSPLRHSPQSSNKKTKRCPKGTRKNKKTGNCEKS